MEPIRDVSALRPVLDALREKKLIASLTPEGRGHMISHALYRPQEMEKLRAQFAHGAAPAASDEDQAEPAAPATPTSTAHSGGRSGEVEELKAQVSQLRADLEDLSATVAQLRDEVQQFRSELGG
jgi:uncharacterized protein